MRDYALKESQRRPGSSVAGVLRQVVRNWINRRAIRKLDALSDHELKDIGLMRGDLYYVMRLPLTVDPIWEMDRLRMLSARRGIRPNGD